MVGKGKTIDSYSIDCIENDLGYVDGNIRVLPLGENARKKTKHLVYDYEHKWARVYTIKQSEENSDNPF